MKTPNAKDIQAAYEHGKFLRRQECTGEGRMLADLSHEVQMLRETCAASFPGEDVMAMDLPHDMPRTKKEWAGYVRDGLHDAGERFAGELERELIVMKGQRDAWIKTALRESRRMSWLAAHPNAAYREDGLWRIPYLNNGAGGFGGGVGELTHRTLSGVVDLALDHVLDRQSACEGCGNPRTTSDSDGVPLCDACAKACDQDAKNEKEATP